MNVPLRIVKVGGSLFDREELPGRLRKWLARQEPALNVLIAGGGELTESIRRADGLYGLGEATSHELCVGLLDVAARLLAALLPEARFLEDWATLHALPARHEQGVVIFSTTRFLRESEAALPGDPLPHAWDVTTDSIAARIAELAGADELVLLKSASPPNFVELTELADRGYVDPYFPWAVKPLDEVRFVDLRSEDFPEIYAFE